MERTEGNPALKNTNTQDGWRDSPSKQLIDGKIIAMFPRPRVEHHFVAFNIYVIFDRYLRGKRCTPFGDGVDLYLTDKERYIPDGMIVCDPEKIHSDGVHGAPDLVVEVLSPGTARYDKFHKKDIYEQCGVREYWLVSPGDASIEQYVLKDGKFIFQDIYTLYHGFELAKLTEEEKKDVISSFQCAIFEDLEIDLQEVFARVVTD